MSIALVPAPTRFVVRSVAVADAPNLLSLLDNSGGLSWVTGAADDQHGIVAWGEIDRIELEGPERVSRAQRWWSQWTSNATGDEAIAFASFAFATGPAKSVVIIPEVLVRRDAKGTSVTAIGTPESIDGLIDNAIARVTRPHELPTQHVAASYSDGTRTIEEWKAAVDEAITRINSGELDKVVLARDIVAQLSEPLNVAALLSRLNARFPECWTFCVDGLVGATPELLIRRQGERVTSRVLAGTVRRSSDHDRDGALAAALLGSDKDQEEHSYAVQSVAEALANHCTDMDVPDEPFILRLANVQHLATDVTGELADATPALALAASLHPTAAVCGTPTERAKQVIKEIEGMDRGRYSGPIGWFDTHGDGEFGIALRCALIENDEATALRLYAGCGIVAGSTSESEVAESNAKFGAMRDALA